MKKLVIISVIAILLASCLNGNVLQKEVKYDGYNGAMDSLEITKIEAIDGRKIDITVRETYIYDNKGYLIEKKVYHINKLGKIYLDAQDLFERDKNGLITKEKISYNMQDPHYIAERENILLEREDKKEKWQEGEDTFWGTSYIEKTFSTDKVTTESYTIKKENGEKVLSVPSTYEYNKDGRLIKSTIYNSGDAVTTMEYKYDEYNHLVKITSHYQNGKDAELFTTIPEDWDILKRDDKNNPVESRLAIRLGEPIREMLCLYKYYYRD